MKRFVIAGLIAAQTIASAQPAVAARLDESPVFQSGTFAGARIRLSLGGKPQDQKLRAGLTVAPTLRSRTISDGSRMWIGQGLELGFAGKDPLTLSLGGRPVNRLLAGGTSSQEGKLGISKGATIAIGVGVALVVGAAVFYNAATNCEEHEDECG